MSFNTDKYKVVRNVLPYLCVSFGMNGKIVESVIEEWKLGVSDHCVNCIAQISVVTALVKLTFI